jgi:glutamyl-tRNA reductase
LELSAASFSYPQHDGEIRAEIARRLLTHDPLDEGFVLSTCLRVEIVVPGPESRLRRVLRSRFGDAGAGAAPEIRVGGAAATHLYRIAAGLESPILGETEILTQFRQSLIEAEEAGRVGGLFARLLESAVSAGRQARDLLPAWPHNSMAAVAAQAIGSVDRVAVLGSGVMATAVVDGLMLLPAPPQVSVVARHPEKVPDRPGVDVLAFEYAPRVIAESPAVISATSAKHRLVDHEALSAAVQDRKNPLLLIDLAMPPDFHPSRDDAVHYISIDDLARMADRRPRSGQADEMVELAASDAYRQYRDHHEVGPLIGGLIAGADAIVDDSVRRFSGRLHDPADEAVVRQSAHTVARALLAGPVSYLKAGGRATDAITVIAEAFGVVDD